MSQHLRVDHLQADLRRLAARGGVVVAISQAARAVVELGALVVLARLLVPEDFGLIAMVAAILGLVGLSDLGLPVTTVQRPDLTGAQSDSLFWLNVAVGTAVFAVFVAVAPAIARVYREPRLVPVTIALSTLFVVQGLGAQHLAVMRRQLHFGRIALLDTLAMSLGAFAGIALAAGGAGYWALVAQQVVPICLQSAGAWVVCRWKPGWPPRRVALRELIAPGGSLTGTRFLRLFTRNLQKLLVGTASGASSLGLYSNAYNLWFRSLNRLSAPLAQVAFPVLARLQEDPERFRAYYRQGALVLHSMALPLVAFVFVDAERVIRLVLGDRWLGAVPLLLALGPAALSRVLEATTAWVYLALGATGRQLRWEAASALLTSTGLVAGMWWGALGVATALSVTSVLLVGPALGYWIAGSSLRWSDWVSGVARPALAAALAGLVVLVLAPGRGLSPVASLLADLYVFGSAYVASWLLVPGGRTIAVGIFRSFARTGGSEGRS